MLQVEELIKGETEEPCRVLEDEADGRLKGGKIAATKPWDSWERIESIP